MKLIFGAQEVAVKPIIKKINTLRYICVRLDRLTELYNQHLYVNKILGSAFNNKLA